MPANKKIAIVYDWIDKWGGVERVLLALHEIFPDADFFTSYYDAEKAIWAKNLKIKTSFIQELPSLIRGSRIASLPFYPYAFESFDFSDYDLVISVTSSFAKSIITRPETLHICYLLTPTRYLWSNPDDYINNYLKKIILSPYLKKLREWDFIAAQRPDKIIAISETAADRCKKYYQRKSEVINPPFDSEYWNDIKLKFQNSNFKSNSKSKLPHFAKASRGRESYFLVVSRLEPYKKVDLVLRLINLSKQKLIVVGEGSQGEKLRKIAGENVTFLSKVTDEELGVLYSNAQALIMPQEEDFGYVSLEAQLFGCPVISYKKGGASETIIEGKTGLFFEEQSVSSLQDAIQRFDMVKYELKNSTRKFGLRNIERFSRKSFAIKFLSYLTQMSKLKV